MAERRSMKKVLSIIFIFCLMFSRVSCRKLISTEYENVEVTIIDEYHRGVYVTPIRSGKVTTMITHPAVYRITVEYDNVEYIINGRNTYNKYKDKIGQITIGTLEIRTYDDGTVKYDITELQ